MVFLRDHDHRATQRLRRIKGIEKARVVGRDADREGPRVAKDRSVLIAGERQNAAQGPDIPNRIPELPSPIVPLLVTCLRKELPTEGAAPRKVRHHRDTTKINLSL